MTSSDFASTTATTNVSSGGGSGAAATAVGTTWLLGFAEACALVEQRPIPLRFALRYATYNLLPSAVWRTLPAELVAAAAALPHARFVSATASSGGDHHAATVRTQTTARRVLTVQTLRSLRCLVGSYGLAWGCWRWYDTQRSQKVLEEILPEPERVLRVAPSSSSPLSQRARRLHGDHIRQITWEEFHRPRDIDWRALRLRPQPRISSEMSMSPTLRWPCVAVVELEVDSGHELDQISVLRARTVAQDAIASTPDASIVTVATVPAAGTPSWSHGNGVDVYFFAISSIVRFVCDTATSLDASRIVLVDSQASPAKKMTTVVPRLLLQALRHHYNWRVECLSMTENALSKEDVSGDAAIAVLATTIDEAETTIQQMLRQGTIQPEQIIVIVDDQATPSSSASMASSSVLARCAGVLSTVDVTDRVLRDVRQQLRAGVAPAAIQAGIYERFGFQRALLERSDHASETTKYI